MFRELMKQNTTEEWAIALGAIVLWMLVFTLVRRVVLRRLTPAANASPTRLDDFIVDILSATRVLLAVAVGIFIAGHYLDLPDRMQTGLDRIFIALMLVQGGLWADRGLQFWLKGRFSPSSTDTAGDAGAMVMTRGLLIFTGKVVLWSIVLLMILDNMGLDVTALIASLGIGGIAVALAVQNILGDLFASLSITIDKPFVIGDFIIVDDFLGTVEHVGLKTTRLRSLSGEQLVFSNNDLLGSRIRNYKRMNERRAVFKFGVAYGTPADKVAQVSGIIREIIEAEADVRFDRGHFFAFGPSSLDFEVVYYLLKPDYNFYMDVQERINLGLVRRLTELGIAFALPMQRVYMDGAGLQPVRHLHPQSGEAVAAQPASQAGQPWGKQEGQQGNEGRDGQPSSSPSLIMPTGR